jgi:hypothetical protein
MSRISEEQLAAFGDELSKQADALGVMKRFGQRQLHSLTGWTPHGFHSVKGLREMSTGATGAEHAVAKALQAGDAKKLQHARKAFAANHEAERLGLTSLPGMAKALLNKETRGKVIPAAIKQQWEGTNLGEKALLVGVPAGLTAVDMASSDDGHKGERVGAGIAGTAAGMLTGGMPFVGGAVAGLAAGKAGGMLGRGIDKFRHKGPPPEAHVQPPPNPEDARGQSVAVEREMSPAAAGQRPEVLG